MGVARKYFLTHAPYRVEFGSWLWRMHITLSICRFQVVHDCSSFSFDKYHLSLEFYLSMSVI